MKPGKKPSSSGAGCALALALTLALPASALAAQRDDGVVYAMSNQPSANSVLVYDRAADGTLTYARAFLTGGTGAGTGADPLGSQGALLRHAGFVLAANAGSNDVSMFQAHGDELLLVDRAASGGTMPVSIAAKGLLVYVLNAGDTPNISGFLIDPEGRRLVPLPGSQRPLAGGPAASPAEVRFASDGETLLVTEKGTQTIDTYRVDARGYASAPTATAASAATPFGFDVTRRGYAIVSEAGAGAVSSYDIGDDGALTLVSGPIALGQAAPCWVVTSRSGRFAFTANAGSGTISSLRIGSDGTLTLVDAAAALLAAPLDMALTADGRFLYARDGNGGITGFRVQADGSLVYATSVTGIAVGAQGIAAN